MRILLNAHAGVKGRGCLSDKESAGRGETIITMEGKNDRYSDGERYFGNADDCAAQDVK